MLGEYEKIFNDKEKQRVNTHTIHNKRITRASGEKTKNEAAITDTQLPEIPNREEKKRRIIRKTTDSRQHI